MNRLFTLIFLRILLILVIGFILFLYSNPIKALGEDKSVTIAPVSFTYHPLADGIAKDRFNHTVDSADTTTVHPGVTIQYKQKHFQAGTWFFTDSFGKLAGGTMVGVKKDIGNMIDVGAAAGVYVRETTKNINKIPGSYRNKDVEVAPMIGATTALEIPLFDNYNPEVNCLWAIKVNNCSVGLKIGF